MAFPRWVTCKRMALLLGLPLAGCVTVGPDYSPPPLAPPAVWHNAVAGASSPQLAAWWQCLADPVLDELQQAALTHSPDLRTAVAKLREARARVGIAEAARYPTLDAAASARRSESAGAGQSSDSFSLGFDAGWEIDLFGGTRRAIEAANATAEASVESLRDAQVSLVAEVARNYIDLRVQQARLQIARDNAMSQADTEQITRWRVQAGLLTQLELAQASSNLEQTRARLPSLESAIEADLNKLAVLSGLNRETLGQRLETAGAIPTVPGELVASIPAEVLRQRPDVRAAERRLAAQTANIGVATAELYPALRLSGSFALSALRADQLLRSDAASNSLLAGLSAPLFDGGRIRRNIAVQNALQEQTMIAYEKAVAQAYADVESGLVAFAKAKERDALLARALESARLAEEIARQRFSTGLIDFATLLETQRSLLSLQDQQASSKGDQATALVQLYKAFGGGWQQGTPSATDSGVPHHD
ncbi:MAG: efflux transporter outer membrane subunit [Uliginosibacterium sp.]|nr:efflux transporter outer membrane subunit [Uliginosibacterium sp.]